MRVLNCNGNNIFSCPPPHGDFYLIENAIYKVRVLDAPHDIEERAINLFSESEEDHDSSGGWWCSFEDFRRYLKEGKLKIVLEKK